MSVEIFENDISRKKETAILAWTSTVHKVQDLSLQQGVIDFDLEKQKLFGPEQLYTVLSRVKAYENLYCIGKVKKSAIEVNKDALLKTK